MSLQLLANHMASQGRGPDTMLMHVAPSEVHAMRALANHAGGDLTINPSTGLPEAGILSSLLPMVAGAFLGPLGMGLSPLLAGGIVGGISGLASGSLSKGLMAGMGAWGGSGLADALVKGGSTATAASTAASQAAAPTDALVGGRQALQGMGGAQGMPAELAGGMNPEMYMNGAANPVNATMGSQPVISNFQPTPGVSAWDSMKAGFGKAVDAPMDFLKENGKYGIAALSPVASEMGKPKNVNAPPPSPSYIRPYSYDTRTNQDAFRPQTGDTSERKYFDQSYTAGPVRQLAEGGMIYDYKTNTFSGTPLVSDANQQIARSAVGGDAGIAALPQFTYNPANQQFTQVQPQPGAGLPAAVASMPYEVSSGDAGASTDGGTTDGPGSDAGGDGGSGDGGWAAGGGINALPGGRMLDGPGTGLSDEISASIEGKQPARLADGEFVVSADVVSALGGGSTKSGAKQLMAMMDRIRKQAHGSTTQVRPVNPKKVLPA